MGNISKRISNNWRSGLTVALVSIPLSIALAIASGATPTQGIITAFWAGLIASFLGGSHYNIIGPTGALSGILLTYTIVNGPTGLPFIAIISGCLILIAYLLHLDRYIIFIPKSVVHGFTLGVAIIIGLGQLDTILGLQNIPKTESLLHNTIISLQHLPQMVPIITLIFLAGTAFIFFWNKKFQKMPGAILLTGIGILIIWIAETQLGINTGLTTLGERYPEIKSQLTVNIWSTFSWSFLWNKQVWVVSLATALIAILETLLSGQIADGMTDTKFNRSKEMLALAMANIGSGLAGGIPATAALARTALNIKSGANHKISGFISAICIALISLVIFQYFKLLPMVVIASILVIVAMAMVEKHHFITLLDNAKVAFALSLMVAVITVVEDPIIGILTGTAVALLIFVNKVSYGQTEILLWKDGKMSESLLKNDFLKKTKIHSDLVVYKISGTLTYINMPAHLETAEKIKGNTHVIVSLRHAFYADTDGIEYLKELIEILKHNNEKIFLSGINKEIEKLIVKENFYKRKLVEGKIYTRTSEAINEIMERNK